MESIATKREDGQLTYIAESKLIDEGTDFQYGDFNGDGNIDRVVLNRTTTANNPETRYHINVKPGLFKIVEGAQFTMHSGISNVSLFVCDTDIDGKAEICITYTQKDSAFLDIIKAGENLNLLKPIHNYIVHGYDFDLSGTWDGGVKTCGLIDIGGRERFAILSYNSGLDLVPRGIIAFDPNKGKELWRFPCGVPVYNAEQVDVDNNSIPELLLSTDSPGNGVFCRLGSSGYEYATRRNSKSFYAKYSMDGALVNVQENPANHDKRLKNILEDYTTSDDSSYVICLNPDGSLLWKTAMGGKFSDTQFRLKDMNGDRLTEIIAFSDHALDSSSNIISYLSGEDGRVIKSSPPMQAAVKDMVLGKSRDGGNIIVSLLKDGTFIIHDQELSPMYFKKIYKLRSLNLALDIDSDGTTEYAFLTDSDDLIITDYELVPLAFIEGVISNSRIFNSDAHRQQALIYNQNGRFYYTTFERRGFTEIIFNRYGLFISLFIAALLILPAIFIIRVRTKRNMNRLWLAKVYRILHNDIRGKIQNISGHAIKLFEHENADNFSAEYAQSILDQSEEISATISSAEMLLKPEKLDFQYIDINQILIELVSSQVVKLHREITIENELYSDLLMVKVDINAIVEVFENIIGNAMNAMPNGGTIRIVSTMARSLHTKRKMAQVEFRDTGLGIPPNDLKRIFKMRYSTSKEGLGFGLAFSRDVIRKHNGKIWAENNPEGGAAVIIRLPLAKES